MAEKGFAAESVGVDVLIMPDSEAPPGLGGSVRATVEEQLHALGYTTQRFQGGGLGGVVTPHLDAMVLEALRHVAQALPLYLASKGWELTGQWREHKRREDLPRATVHLRVQNVHLSHALMRNLPDIVAKLGAAYRQVRLCFIYSLVLPDHISHAYFEYPLRTRAANEVERKLETGSKQYFSVAWRPSWWPGTGVDATSATRISRRGSKH